MYFFDAHTHPQFSAYELDREKMMDRARETGVKMVAIGTQAANSRDALALARMYPDDVWAAVGFHPSHAETEEWHHDKNEQEEAVPEAFDSETLCALAADDKAVAIGECGLDYYRTKKEETKRKQQEIFVAQMEIARDTEKPLMIHCREAFPDLIKLIEEHGKDLKPGIVHFFSGTEEDAKALMELGYYFTFGGVVTFSRDYDKVIELIGAERILSETDAPYVAPEPHRGKRNEPFFVVEVVKQLSEILKMYPEELQMKIWQNANQILDLA